MTNTETYEAAAARIAAAAILTTDKAQRLLDHEPGFLDRAERIAVALDNTGLYEDVPFADLSDAAYQALADRCHALGAK